MKFIKSTFSILVMLSLALLAKGQELKLPKTPGNTGSLPTRIPKDPKIPQGEPLPFQFELVYRTYTTNRDTSVYFRTSFDMRQLPIKSASGRCQIRVIEPTERNFTLSEQPYLFIKTRMEFEKIEMLPMRQQSNQWVNYDMGTSDIIELVPRRGMKSLIYRFEGIGSQIHNGDCTRFTSSLFIRFNILRVFSGLTQHATVLIPNYENTMSTAWTNAVARKPLFTGSFDQNNNVWRNYFLHQMDTEGAVPNSLRTRRDFKPQNIRRFLEGQNFVLVMIPLDVLSNGDGYDHVVKIEGTLSSAHKSGDLASDYTPNITTGANVIFETINPHDNTGTRVSRLVSPYMLLKFWKDASGRKERGFNLAADGTEGIIRKRFFVMISVSDYLEYVSSHAL